ncbi:MAG: NAD(P)-dependent dehydrogenase (short-subunit alcohol dehydrogenase family) [Cellvibrionaceae bacterium]|jgi:NAD(P)-dependent dehydrogenase (short-subunit alcohol dehydrogenase family)
MSKTALVTGGNSGVGYATAKLLKAKGYDVIICGRNKARVDQAAKELNIRGIVTDMGKPDSVAELAREFTGKTLDALVNNAAIARFLPLALESDNSFDELINVNLKGPMNLIKGLLEPLSKAKGSITNVSSAIVNNGLPNASFYAATKGGIDAITKSLALELAPKNIRINAVSLGAIDTPIVTKLGLDEETIAAIRTQQEAIIPLRRYGKVDEVAQVIVSQLEATYATGAIWEIDGGVNAY